MTLDDWSCAQRIMQAWPSVPADLPAEGTCRRLRDAVVGLHDGEAGWRDVAALTRQVLLEHQARQGVLTPLVVPADDLLPSKQQWKEVACHALVQGSLLSVTAEPWTPPHSDGEDTDRVAADLREVYAGNPLPRADCPADPFWTDALGHVRYMSVGQRQAARTVAVAPSGSTTIVSMPTGHGKTEVVLAAALPTSRTRGVSVVVVPTVVLALDMERRLRELLDELGEQHSPSGRYAYTGGLDQDIKEDIRRAIREGRQRVVFTSPEALSSGLNPAVREAAMSGLLRYVVIDEAHLVEQWGTEFRPEFQTIAGQIQEWRTAAPQGQGVRTIAMSATLSDRQVDTLVDLFAGDGPTEIVWSSETRREPSYYLHRCPSEADRIARVEEAVAMLPRPLALYVTERADATAWVERLKSMGMHRVTTVTGASSDTDRRRAVERWRGTRTDGVPCPTGVDVVVGTSAFGLGVDMAGVRSVVHACQPETLDRYYQEVGRAGRDRRPAVAFMATTRRDGRIAEGLNRQTVISVEKGWDRWHTLFHSGSEVSPAVFEVSLDSRPPHVADESRQNRQWNVRTLNLTARAGLIRLQSPQPPSRLPGQSPSEWQDEIEKFLTATGSRMWVKILHGAANRREHWDRVIAAERTKVLEEQRRGLAAMLEVLQGDRCVSRIVADYYRVGWQGGHLQTAVNCRSCPACRASPTVCELPRQSGGAGPFPSMGSWNATQCEDPLAALRRPNSWLSLWWDDPATRDDFLPELLEHLVRRGIPAVAGPGAQHTLLCQVQRDAAPYPVIADNDGDLLTNYRGPLIWVMDDDATLEPDVQARLDSDDVTYIIHPRTLQVPGRPSLRLIDVCPTPTSLRNALGVL